MNTYYLTEPRLHRIYYGMLSRCNNPKAKRYNRYGGRGIKVCDEWTNDISLFIAWSKNNGYSDSLQIDRINNDGDYTPENCRWVTQIENCRNTSRTIMVEHNGERKSLRELADYVGMDSVAVYERIRHEWPLLDALNIKVKNKPIDKKIPKYQRELMKRDLAKVIDTHFSFYSIP